MNSRKLSRAYIYKHWITEWTGVSPSNGAYVEQAEYHKTFVQISVVCQKKNTRYYIPVLPAGVWLRQTILNGTISRARVACTLVSCSQPRTPFCRHQAKTKKVVWLSETRQPRQFESLKIKSNSNLCLTARHRHAKGKVICVN